MTELHVVGSALELTETLAAKPELAGPLLELLKAAGGDLAKLQGLTDTALTAAKEALPSIADQLADLRATGVVIVGEKEAAAAGVAVPEKFSVKALQASDPYDPSRTVAQTHGLGFDKETNRWLLIRLGVIPDSLGLTREARIALPELESGGLKMSIPQSEEDSLACFRVAGEIARLWKKGKGERPFTRVWAATDWESHPGFRFLFGPSNARGMRAYMHDDGLGRDYVGAASFAN